MSGSVARLMELFDELCDLSPRDRGPRLAALAAKDPALAQQLRQMLIADGVPGVLDATGGGAQLAMGGAAAVSADVIPPTQMLEAVPTGLEDTLAATAATMAVSAVDRVGSVIAGRYRIEKRIGSGGFGTVYRATQIGVERPVAVKFLRRELSADARASSRFAIEAKAIARIEHRNIIALYDMGRADDGAHFLVIEYLQGEALSDRLERVGALPPFQVVQIGLQALSALGEAHHCGVIHRDIKPENIFMAKGNRRREVVKLLDFGIAKLAANTSGALPLTQSGVAIGSPRFMSPEQCTARPVSPQSDLYSLGLVLYLALTGRPVFEAGDVMGYLMAHATRPAPPPELDGLALRGPLVDLIMSCLEKDPGARPPSAAAALRALKACEHQPLTEAEAPPTLQHSAVSEDELAPTFASRPVSVPAVAPVEAPLEDPGEAPANPLEREVRHRGSTGTGIPRIPTHGAPATTSSPNWMPVVVAVVLALVLAIATVAWWLLG